LVGTTVPLERLGTATVVKLCTQVGYVKSQQKNDKSPLKGAWSASRDTLYILSPITERNAKAKIVKFCTRV